MKQTLLRGGGICCFVLLMILQLPAKNESRSFDRKWTEETGLFIRQTLGDMNVPFPVSYNKQIENLAKKYLTKGRQSFEQMLGKSDYYFPIFEAALNDYGLPGELKYLPLVESRLIPTVDSPVGAGGLWQFMPATASYWGLTMDEWVDHRYDPYLSSAAAAKMLNELHLQFEDWELVLAAYNCGPGRVRKAIRKAGTKEYDRLKSFLPSQTRHYLIKYTATALVIENHKVLGLLPKQFDLKYDQTTVLKVYDWMSLEGLSESIDVDRSTLERLNPAYKKGIIPKNDEGNLLVIPSSAAISLEDFLTSKGIVAISYLRGEPERFESEPTTEYWASAHVRPLPGKVVFQFNLQGLLSWRNSWGSSLFNTLKLGEFLASQLWF